jgi:hypothetical protein
MMRTLVQCLVAAWFIVGVSGLRAEVTVEAEANHGDSATAEFKFDKIPSFSKTDAANDAVITVLSGRRDQNGAEASCLNDGQAPSDPDEPAANFFFAAGTDGGRLLIDLGKPVEIKRIATYSWHPSARGPQVYKLYGDASKEKDFDAAKAGRADELDESQWKQIAAVDTRPEEGEPGGQYGVNITDDAGKTLGTHRYLLFDVSRTGGHEFFDNTFYSEIDVVDGQRHEPPARKAPAERVVDVLKIGDEYEIAFDTTDAPELKAWVDEKLKPVCAEWYPKIVEMLPSDDYQAPRRFSIVFEKDMRGVAYTGGRRVVCAVPWFSANLEGEAAGAVVHELVHVVQQYGRARRGERPPGWMVEGLADYIRWFLYEPENLRPRPNPDRAHYTDSYRTTAAFLNHIVNEHDKDCIRKFNAAMRDGEFSDDLWKEYTGKTADELWEEYVAKLRQ